MNLEACVTRWETRQAEDITIMNIRQFSKQDTQSVIELWHACGLTRPWNDPSKDIARKLQVQPELFLVGELDGKVIASAMAGYDGHRGSVFYLAVSPAFQKRGYGGLLMKRIEDLLKAMGCPKLNIVVRTTNEKVLAFYRELGYTRDDVVSIGKRLIPDSPDVIVSFATDVAEGFTQKTQLEVKSTNVSFPASVTVDLKKCSFCGKQAGQYAQLFGQNVARICDQCVALVERIRIENAFKPDSRNDHIACSFCGKQQKAGVSIVAGPGVFICSECGEAYSGRQTNVIRT